MTLDRAARTLCLKGGRTLCRHPSAEELFCNDERLLSNGDRWESLLARRLELDAPYR